ncbi:MAG: hypothetical protein LBH43_00640 [Treponema sp.]|nr:hypothetical protein [Treponema sp.]
MKEKPVIFSTPMVQALLNTKPGIRPAEAVDPDKPFKSMTRRVVKPQPEGKVLKTFSSYRYGFGSYGFVIDGRLPHNIQYIKTKYEIGDILWVREKWALSGSNCILYYADKAESVRNCIKWKPSIHMPREAARLFLEVKSVRVERLQSISEKDAISEGILTDEQCGDIAGAIVPGWFCPVCNGTGLTIGAGENLGAVEAECSECETAEKRYRLLWDSINAERGYSWESNPWVWAVGFGRVGMPLKSRG